VEITAPQTKTTRSTNLALIIIINLTHQARTAFLSFLI